MKTEKKIKVFLIMESLILFFALIMFIIFIGQQIKKSTVRRVESVIRSSIANGGGFIFMDGDVYQVAYKHNGISFRAVEVVEPDCLECHTSRQLFGRF